MTDYQKVKLQASHGPDVHFEGRLIGAYSTQNRARTKSRWTELRLWETRSGEWIAESVGCSDNEREFDIVEATVIEKVRRCDAVLQELASKALGRDPAEGIAIADKREEEERRKAVMRAWGWTTAAKAFAREMGWDVILRVE